MTTPDIFYLIQRKSDGYFAHPTYFASGEPNTLADPEWYKTNYGAESFTNHERAMEYIKEHNLEDVEIMPFVSVPLFYFKHCEIALGWIMQARNIIKLFHNDNA